MPRVLICDKLEAAGLDLLKQSEIEVDNRPGLKDAALADALHAADGAVVRSGTRITADLLEAPGRLKAIVRAGVGVDNIDVQAATRKGIVVMNTPGGNTVSAAEHTIALMLSLARHIPTSDAGMKAGKWDRGKYIGAQLAGKTLGVVGLGRIGREVARRAAGLDMKIVGYDPFLAPDRAAQLGIQAFSSVHELLPICDFLTLHLPLNDETRNLIGAKELAMMHAQCPHFECRPRRNHKRICTCRCVKIRRHRRRCARCLRAGTAQRRQSASEGAEYCADASSGCLNGGSSGSGCH